MDEKYIKSVTETAIEKLTKKGSPMRESEFTRELVALLKKKYGKDDLRHSSKIRFRKDVFKFVVETSDWKSNIIKLNDKKFSLKIWYKDSNNSQDDSEYNWSDSDLETAVEKMLHTLKKIDPFKLEELVKKIVEKMWGYSCEVTRKTGDMGIDVVGYKKDDNFSEKKEAIYIQVKRFEGSVNRDYADKFVGAVKEFYIKEKYAKFTGLFVTTGKFPDSFTEKLKNSSETGISFYCWDGKLLVKNLIQLGWGIKYSFDIDFWNNLDSTIIPKEIILKKETQA